MNVDNYDNKYGWMCFNILSLYKADLILYERYLYHNNYDSKYGWICFPKYPLNLKIINIFTKEKGKYNQCMCLNE